MFNKKLTWAGIIATALADFDTWSPAGEGDVRAPCPMLNSLANHGFLPHDGKNLTLDVTTSALSDGLNFDAEVTKFLFDFAVTTNPEENATFFDLDHLGRHNILEHDGSLSRVDSFFGDASVFDQATFNMTKSFFTGDTITVKMFADARQARMIDSLSHNPGFSISELGAEFSYGETIAPFLTFGDIEGGTVSRELVEFFFENEKLPVSLGWERRTDSISQEDLFGMMDRAKEAATGQKPSPVVKRRDVHGHGFYRV